MKVGSNGVEGRFGGSEKGTVHLSWNTVVGGQTGALTGYSRAEVRLGRRANEGVFGRSLLP